MLSGRNHMLCKCCTVTLKVTRGLAGISQCQSPAASSLPHSPQCPEEPSVPHSKLLVGQNCLAEHAAHRCRQAGTAHRPSAQARPGASSPTQSTHNDSRCEKATNIHRLYSTPVVSYLGVAFEPLCQYVCDATKGVAGHDIKSFLGHLLRQACPKFVSLPA